MNKERKLIDIDDLQIDVNRPKKERINELVSKVENPLHFKSHGYEVIVTFAQNDVAFSDSVLGIFL